MHRSDYLLYNGNFYLSNEPVISANNRSFRYGDGFFETMKMISGKIIFEDLHFERLLLSLQIMQFDKPDFFTPDYLLQQIQSLVLKNNHQQLARIRINFFRGDGNLHEIENNQLNYIIQSWPLQQFPYYHLQGITTGIYKEARKTSDAFSHIKSNNYLPYVMATLWSKKNNFDDALILNCHNRIAEATTSNIFIVKDDVIKTPALSEGCVAGVTRHFLLSCMKKDNIRIEETKITIDEVMNADEIFLTNTGWHIKWIQQCGNKPYTNKTSEFLYEQYITPLVKGI